MRDNAKKDFSCDSFKAVPKYLVVVFPYLWWILFILSWIFGDLGMSSYNRELAAEFSVPILISFTILSFLPTLMYLFLFIYMLGFLHIVGGNLKRVDRDQVFSNMIWV